MALSSQGVVVEGQQIVASTAPGSGGPGQVGVVQARCGVGWWDGPGRLGLKVIVGYLGLGLGGLPAEALVQFS